MIIAVVTLLAVALVAFAVGWFVRPPSASVVNAQGQSIAVWAAAEERVVPNGITAQVEIAGSPVLEIQGAAVAGSNQAVVTERALDVGQQVAVPEFLGAVSGRPLFGLSLPIPLYRDLSSGVTGPDVTSLQQALGVAETGRFDWATMQAFAAMYREHGYAPPGGEGTAITVQQSEIVDLPSEGMTVASSAEVGAALSESVPLVRLAVGAPEARFRATVLEIDSLAVGTQVLITPPGQPPIAAVVRTVGDYAPVSADGNTPPGYDVTIAFDTGVELETGTIAQLTLPEDSVEPSLAVPAVAVRTDSAGDYIVVRAGETQARVPIVVERSNGGWSAISAEELQAGAEVLVSP